MESHSPANGFAPTEMHTEVPPTQAPFWSPEELARLWESRDSLLEVVVLSLRPHVGEEGPAR